jgi:hypothetical protein
MNKMISIANTLMLLSSTKYLNSYLGTQKYRQFKKYVSEYKREYSEIIPNIGKTVFANSYYFSTCYFFYFSALKRLGYSSDVATTIIWAINENLVKKIPGIARNIVGKYYVGQIRKRAGEATEKGRQNKLHPDDWRIEYHEISKTEWKIDIYECYVKKMAERLGLLDMLPGVCRMDYLFSHYFHQGFERTMTLGDGDNRCNCYWVVPGECDWPIANHIYK